MDPGAAVRETWRSSIRARTVSPPPSVEFSVGLVYPNALMLADVDLDGDNELVVGTAEGDLLVCKGGGVWRACDGLSTITAVTVGDVCNTGHTAVVCATAEGVCAIFEFLEPAATDGHAGLPPRTSVGGALPPPQTRARVGSGGGTLTPVHRQRIPVNTKVLLVADLTGDGHNDLIAGRTDRKVLTFRWSAEANKLLPLWEVDCGGQIGSLSMIEAARTTPLLGVSQPGGKMLLINGKGILTEAGVSSCTAPDKAEHGLPTELVGEVRGPVGPDNRRSSLTALCTSSGVIKVGTIDDVHWRISVDRPLFALAKADVSGDGVDELVACAWDGYTAVVDHDRNVVEYEFGSELAAFTAGIYAARPGRNEPCFVYATLQDPETNHCTVSIHHSLSLQSLGATVLPQSLPPFIKEASSVLEKQGIDMSGGVPEVYASLLRAEEALMSRRDALVALASSTTNT
eukprot:m.220008 g.220008  ORF g.220008 m.220008 type:complete len:458 (+) comp30796_c0_seq1:264-1637(+)